MASTRQRKGVLFFIIMVLLAIACRSQIEPPSFLPRKHVATYYFYWYDIYTNSHMDALTDHPKDMTDFSFNSVDWHKKELRDMCDAGIDIVLPVYWGDKRHKESWSIAGLEKLVEAQYELITQGVEPPKIGMFYDTTAMDIQYPNCDLTTEDGKIAFYSMIRDFFNEIPMDLWARIEGKPIVWLWISFWVKEYDQSTFDYLKQAFLADFGIEPYVVKEATWGDVKTDNFYRWWAAISGPNLDGILALGPGYDDSTVPGRIPLYKDREDGDFYRRSWEEALANSEGKDIVVIETWNEFHEATDIANSREYGRTYIKITKKYSHAFRQGKTSLD